MFGYIKPLKPEMKVKEFDTYQAIYCGLCKQLGKEYGLSSRFTLSYDYTFLSLLSLGLSKNNVCYQRQNCIAHPLKKRPCLQVEDDLSFVAASAMLMVYYKIKDNVEDGSFWERVKNLLLLPVFVGKKKKAEKKYPKLGTAMATYIEAQKQIQQKQTPSVDASAEPTAKVLSEIATMLVPEGEDVRALSRLGYLVGRYVYLIDALDDLEDDLKTGNFNVFVEQMKQTEKSIEETKDYAKGVLNVTVGQIAESYELLSLVRYQTILDNIIYLGLHSSLMRVIAGKPTQPKEI